MTARISRRALRNELISGAALLLAALTLWAVAYRAPLALTLHIGGDAALQRRDDDGPFLRGFNAPEPASASEWRWWTLPPGYAYRWTKADATVALPGLGGGRWVVSLLAQSGRPNEAVPVEWLLSGMPSLRLSLPPGDARRYHLLADSGAAGDLRLDLRAAPYSAPGDSRELGFVLRQLRATPAGQLAPPPAQLGLLALSLACIYGLTRWLALGRRSALALGAACALMVAYCLAFQRLALTSFTPTLTTLALGCAALAAAAISTGRVSLDARRKTVDESPHAPAFVYHLPPIVLALTLLAFALRLGGMLHPQALFSDARFNANNLFQVGLGEVFLSAGLPAEAGGGRAPYPPGLYLALLPLQLLLPTGIDGRVLLVQAGVAALDSLVLAMIGGLLLQAGFGRRAALYGMACYLLPPSLLQAFSVGEYANIGGQALALGFVALLATVDSQRLIGDNGRPSTVHRPPSTVHRPPSLLLLSAALAVGLLAHSGVTLSLGAFVAAAWGLALLGWLKGGENTALRLKVLTIVSIAALAFAIACYYSAPLYLAGFTAQAGGVGSTPRGSPPLVIIGDTVRSVLGLARPQGRAPLPPLLGVAALAGLALIRLRGTLGPAAAPLARTLAAWWLGMLLGQSLLLVADQGLRWTIFLYPALCLGAGPLLAALEQRGRNGKIVARAALAATLIYGLALWLIQIRDYFHI